MISSTLWATNESCLTKADSSWQEKGSFDSSTRNNGFMTDVSQILTRCANRRLIRCDQFLILRPLLSLIRHAFLSLIFPLSTFLLKGKLIAQAEQTPTHTPLNAHNGVAQVVDFSEEWAQFDQLSLSRWRNHVPPAGVLTHGRSIASVSSNTRPLERSCGHHTFYQQGISPTLPCTPMVKLKHLTKLLVLTPLRNTQTYSFTLFTQHSLTLIFKSKLKTCK